MGSLKLGAALLALCVWSPEASGKDLSVDALRSLLAEAEAAGGENPCVAIAFDALSQVGSVSHEEAYHRCSVEARVKASGPNHASVANALDRLAMAFRNAGRYDEAAPLFERALAISERSQGAAHEGTARIAEHLGWTYRHQNRFPESEAALRRALGVWEKTPRAPRWYLGEGHYLLATVVQAQGRHAEAETLYRRSLELVGSPSRSMWVSELMCLNGLAATLRETGRLAEAEAALQKAIAILDANDVPMDHGSRDETVRNLAALREAQSGRAGEATPLERRALAIREKRAAPPPQRERKAQVEDAGDFLHALVEAVETALGPEHPQVAASLRVLGNLHCALAIREQAR